MKKFFTILLMLFTVISIAMAQPATMTKGQVDSSTELDSNSVCQETRDDLNVELVYTYDWDEWHPADNIDFFCTSASGFTTAQEYSQYFWETDLPYEIYEDKYLVCMMENNSHGYIKVTVYDGYGNTGSDSIYFNIKNWINPLENFIMEIDDDLYPVFSGTATPEHYSLRISRGFRPGEEGGAGNVQNFYLEPGEWIYKDENTHYNQDTLWIFKTVLKDTCSQVLQTWIPGLLLSTNQENNKWYLDMRTILQTGGEYYSANYGLNCVYFVYTIDENGQRHHIIDEDGEPTILPSNATSWSIPDIHTEPYYQCGVAKILDDGNYELLSLSNKVPNPLYDPTSLNEQNEKSRVSVYPNPSNGILNINGTGIVSITNILGQTIITKEIDGQKTIELPKGIYIINTVSGNSNSTQKIVVE